MSVNLLTAIQKSLGYPELKKVDPNTQEVMHKDITPDIQRFAQAAIPSILAGINNLAKSDEGALQIASENLSSDWLALLFGENKISFIGNVASYSMFDRVTVTQKMNEIASEAIRLIRENSHRGEDGTAMKKFIADQRNHFYPYIPAAIDLGHLVNDNTIDDRTHKMQGPISSLMHKIESSFGGSETAEDVERKAHN